MDLIMHYICIPLGWLMSVCLSLVRNYGWAIILFTLATKIILLPLSVWIQKNSILMVKIQPEINFIKARLYGNKDAIAEEQSSLFKKENYHPMLSLVPLAVQLILLMGVVFVIEEEIAAGAEMHFCGFELSSVPSQVLGVYILVPVLAGLSSWVLCFTQNQANVIQHEQGKLSQIGLMVLSIGISLYLGFFVPAGVALYWIASNLFSVLQMYLLNAAINPKDYVDYDALEKSRKALADIEALDASDSQDPARKENRKREKADWKRFTKVANKHIVFYSEKSGFYKYFKDLIEALLARSNVTIHYVTNDPDDVIFSIAETQPRIRPYYISLKKCITLFMMLDTDIMVMSTPDLDKFYLKRSQVRKDIEYIYVPHDMMSMHMGFREGALDAFDTIFCTGPHIEKEVRATEDVYGLPAKKLVRFGYPLADELIRAGEEERRGGPHTGPAEILIAPSWQEDNLLDSCVDVLIEKLLGPEYHIIVRPHPEYVKRYGARMQQITERYAGVDESLLSFELDFSSSRSIYSSDLIITDWSGVGPEFCFATGRPALFVNTKMKCVNPNWQKIPMTPVEISLRDRLGVSVDKEQLQNVRSTVETLLNSKDRYREDIGLCFDELIFNHGTAAAEGAAYILRSLVEKKNNSSR